jgi:hypothetical protein
MPLSCPDLMYLGTKVIEMPDEYSYLMETLIISKKYERVATRAIARIVSYDYSKRQKVPTPEWLRKKVEEIESKAKYSPNKLQVLSFSKKGLEVFVSNCFWVSLTGKTHFLFRSVQVPVSTS